MAVTTPPIAHPFCIKTDGAGHEVGAFVVQLAGAVQTGGGGGVQQPFVGTLTPPISHPFGTNPDGGGH